VLTLNDRAWRLADAVEADADRLRAAVTRVGGARVIDLSAGGLEAGLRLARVCLADLADVALVPGESGPAVQVTTDDPVRTCLASQYAGWQVKAGSYFAMGSGPMRAVAGREELFKHVPGREESASAVGVLETRKAPTEEVVAYLVERLPTTVERITLLFAPAASLPGTLQVVARSVETALHKLHELGFDVTKVASGYGVAPLPPVAKDELAAVGRTNDAILYGGRVTLWVRADDAEIEAVGPRVPSSGSKDHGAPFAELFARYGDFYKIDPLLFSPAEVTLVNVATGRAFRYGRTEPALLKASFGV
jgi:methenyltetrahydromethanopterin cyclohydrolase